MSSNKLHAVARCRLCSQVLLDLEIDEVDKGGFEEQAWRIRHTCKFPPANYRADRRFTYEPLPEGTE